MQKIRTVRCLVLAGFALATGAWAGSCVAATPAAAVQAWVESPSLVDALPSTQSKSRPGGYRVERVMSDSVLNKQWALVASCAQPARPFIAVELPRTVHPHFTTVHIGAANTGAAGWDSLNLDIAKISIFFPAYIPVQVRLAAAAAAAWMQNLPAASPMLVHAGDRVVLWNREPELHLAIAAVSLEYGREGQIIHLRRDNPNTLQNVTMTGVVRGPGSVELLP